MALQDKPFVTERSGRRRLLDDSYHLREVPNPDGIRLSDAAGSYYAPVEWEPNTAFPAEMKFTGALGKGGRFYVEDENGTLYNIFPSDLARYLAEGSVREGGIISGIWRVTKKNTAFGVQLV